MLVVGRGEQQLGRVGRAAGDDDDVGGEGLRAAVALDHDLGDGGARPGWCAAPAASAFVSSVTFGVLERRPHGEHLGVGLGVHQAREAVAGRAADAGAVGHVAPRRA